MTLVDDKTQENSIDSDLSEMGGEKTSETTPTPAAKGKDLIGRTIFVVITALSVGVFTGSLLRKEEGKSIEQKFISDAEAANRVVYAKAIDGLDQATTAMAEVLSTAFPDYYDWPNVWMDGFQDIATELLPRGRLDDYKGDLDDNWPKYGGSPGMGLLLAPMVSPEQMSDFEDFVEEQAKGQRGYGRKVYAPTPYTGPGVGPYVWRIPRLEEGEQWDNEDAWDRMKERNPLDDIYKGESSELAEYWSKEAEYWSFSIPRDEVPQPGDNEVDWNSPERIRVPVVQSSHEMEAYNMWNLYRSPQTMRTIDNVLECTKQNTIGKMDCKAIGSMERFPIPGWSFIDGPAVTMVVPVYPANANLKTPVGFVIGIVGLERIMSDIGKEVDFGFEAVFKTSEEGHEEVVTYARCKEGGSMLEPGNFTTPEAHKWNDCYEEDVWGYGIGMVKKKWVKDKVGDYVMKGYSDVHNSTGPLMATDLSPHFTPVAGSAELTLKLYPDHDYYLQRQGPVALYGGLVAACIVVVASVLFFVASDRCGGSGTKE